MPARKKTVTEKRWALYDSRGYLTVYPRRTNKQNAKLDARLNEARLSFRAKPAPKVSVVRVTLTYEAPDAR